MNKIVVIDFGSQYTQLISRLIRELHVYCEVIPYQSFIYQDNILGVILSGGPQSVTQENYPLINLLELKVPVLGLCYGSQLIVKEFGGEVRQDRSSEYGKCEVNILEDSLLLEGIEKKIPVWMSHQDTITKIPPGCKILGISENQKIAMFQYQNFYGFQFHPEVTHTKSGKKMLDNFLKMTRCDRNWTEENFIKLSIENIKNQVGDSGVIMALSGGVDSMVAAHLVHQAIPDKLTCIIVNNGLLRLHEYQNVLQNCQKLGMNIQGVDASDRFYEKLTNITDPEEKRKIIGNLFIEVFTETSQKLTGVEYLGQGTIYPDIIESVEGIGKIKSHHNVGGLPKQMKLKLLEPLRFLFKDEVRRVGLKLGMSQDFIFRHPFPGPGLGIRILGNITRERVKILQQADFIFTENLKSEGLYHQIWQAGAIFLPIKSVGVMGDCRTYENVICLRAVESINGMTADWFHFPKGFLSRVSNNIINQVSGVNRVVYDISSKPPATIEWE